MPRAVRQLVDGICASAQQGGPFTYELKVSVIEIYCEQIRDLLDPYSDAALQVRRLTPISCASRLCVIVAGSQSALVACRLCMTRCVALA